MEWSENVAGLFITIEGPDGAGKTSQVSLLAAHLEKLGIHYLKTREPGGTPISDQIRQLLLNPDHTEMDAKAEALLYAASRAQLVAEVIRPALAKGYVVICDRYIDASIAYQGSLGLRPEDVRKINEFATGGLYPDRTYIIDIDPKIGIERIRRARRNEFAGGLDRIEQRELDYHTAVREQFLSLIQHRPNQYKLIDGNQPQDVIAALIREDVIGFLKSN
jgi:dTMP kinase